MNAQQIAQETQRDKVLSRIYHITLNGWPGNPDPEFKPYHTRKEQFTSELGCLLGGNGVVIPDRYQSDIHINLHENHTGTVRMKALARGIVWWPNIDSDIERTVQNSNPPPTNTPSTLRTSGSTWKWPIRPQQRVHTDCATYQKLDFLIVVHA